MNNGRSFRRRAAAEHHLMISDAQAADFSVGRRNALKLPCARVERAEVPVALLVESANDLLCRREAIRRHAKPPLRHAEFSRHLTENFRLAIIVAIEVPPSRA